jgi:hypothetical protein
MIKEEIQLRYFNRLTKQITEDKQNDNDFYLVKKKNQHFMVNLLSTHRE